MKNFLVISLALIAVGSIASATPACSTTIYTETALNTSGFTCEDGDKIFSSFSISGADPNLVVQFTALPSPYTTPISLEVSDSTGAALAANFTLSYTIGVDASLIVGGYNYISVVSTGGTDSLTSVATNTVSTNNAGCSSISSVDNGSGHGFSSSNCSTSGQPTSLLVTDSYAWTSGTTATQIQDTFVQAYVSTTTPEPGSMMLLGGGLLAAGLIGRKKLVRK